MSTPPNVLLARLVLSGVPFEEIARHPDPEVRALLHRRRDALQRLAEAARHVDHATGGPDALARLRDGFDAAARLAPEASVAAYTLGDPELERAATAELVAWLDAHRLLGPDRDVLDLGCGNGRVAQMLVPRVRSVTGVDLSAEMIAQARRRCPEARFFVVDGLGLSGGRGGGKGRGDFHLILAVDSVPYLVQAGVAETHIADAARLLLPGGALAILNLSYRGLEPDRQDAADWAARFGFALTCAGDQPFSLWDGRAFLFLKPAG